MKILVVEDHAFMLDAYRSNLEPFFSGQIFYSSNITDAICTFNKNPEISLVFVDLFFPGTTSISGTGIDFCKHLRSANPEVKIVIISAVTESIIIYDIIKVVNPEGFLAKSDCNSAIFKECLNSIFSEIYYSQYIKTALQTISSLSPFMDQINRKILMLLNQGVKNKNICDHVMLSLSAIDKRKSLIKDYLGIEGDDETLLKEARNRGFIS